VLLLEEFGPQLGRPHADTLKGSRIKNLKELRARTSSQKSFYKKLIQSAEMLT